MKKASLTHTIGIVGVSSLVSLGLTWFREWYSGHSTYTFFVWNFFLAWIPFLLSCLLVFLYKKRSRDKLLVGIVGLLWLLFYPNAPYLVTELIHFQTRPGMPLWFDGLLLLSVAWNGLVLAFVPLFLLQQLVMRVWGSTIGWVFATGVMVLGSIGIYLGRFLRWNSWDIFTHPQGVIGDIVSRFSPPWSYPHAFSIAFAFSVFFLCGYCIVWTLLRVNGKRAFPH